MFKFYQFKLNVCINLIRIGFFKFEFIFFNDQKVDEIYYYVVIVNDDFFIYNVWVFSSYFFVIL